MTNLEIRINQTVKFNDKINGYESLWKVVRIYKDSFGDWVDLYNYDSESIEPFKRATLMNKKWKTIKS